jgi:hypothetical protein
MARPGILKRVHPGWLVGASLLLLAALCAVTAQSPFDTDQGPGTSLSADTPASVSQDLTTRGIGGMKAYRDPVTGERAGPPPGAVAPSGPEALGSSLSRSEVGLEAVPTGTPAGGIRVDLKGRFRSSLVATKRPDGTIATRCVHELPQTQGEE